MWPAQKVHTDEGSAPPRASMTLSARTMAGKSRPTNSIQPASKSRPWASTGTGANSPAAASATPATAVTTTSPSR